MNKKIRTLLSLLLVTFILVSCSSKTRTRDTAEHTKRHSRETAAETYDTEKPTEPSETTETEITETSRETIRKDIPIEEQLMELDGVVSVEELEYSSISDTDARNFMVIFEQPLDWSDPSAGTFEQRVQFVYTGAVTSEFYVGGYLLPDDFYLKYGDMLGVFASQTGSNFVNAEYRFFGESVPEGLDNSKPDYWNYLTNYNAACDFHHIFEQFDRILSPNGWVMTGGSKGGMATMLQSMYFPDDAAIYVPFVAPYSDGPQAEDFFDNIYETIGDEKYGPEKAAEYRDLVLEFQVEAIKHRDELQQRYYDYGIESGAVFSDYTTPEILYDMAVLEFATATWQYYQGFSSISKVLDMKGSDDCADRILDLLIDANEPDTWSMNTVYFPYYIQAKMEMGEHEYDFSFLREALEKDGSGAELVITEDMEDMLLYKMTMTPEVFDAITYDSTSRDMLIKWEKETDCQVIQLFGGADVWYAMRLPDVPDRDNFITIVVPYAAHSNIYLEDLSYEEADEVLDRVISAQMQAVNNG